MLDHAPGRARENVERHQICGKTKKIVEGLNYFTFTSRPAQIFGTLAYDISRMIATMRFPQNFKLEHGKGIYYYSVTSS